MESPAAAEQNTGFPEIGEEVAFLGEVNEC